ncbi:MAG: response regulator [Alphaproteobacteria bacterium]|nr:response regulator [Alphaproteobacteria bacterium]
MLHVLIVEGDDLFASSLASMFKEKVGFQVVGFANDLQSSRQMALTANVHIAFVDVHLPGFQSGFQVAKELNSLGIACVLVSATDAPFPMPELAATWLKKPYSETAVSLSLNMATESLIARCRSTSSTNKSYLC